MLDAGSYDSSLYDGGPSGPTTTPLVLDQELYCVVLSPDDDPFVLDPELTCVVLSPDDDPFVLDPELTAEYP